MKKNFTEEEKLKCHQTNIKAGQSLYLLSGVLCSIYILRYFITGNFNFYFKLAFPDMFLKLGDSGEIKPWLGILFSALFLLIYFLLGGASMKNNRLLLPATILYITDTVCLLFCDFVLWHLPENSDFIIDIICHLWVILFLVVAVKSERKLKK